MPKCLLVAGSFYPREGGAERQLKAVLGHLETQGIECAVVTQGLRGLSHLDTVPQTNIRIFRVVNVTLFRVAPRLAQILFLLSATLRILRERPSVLISLQLGSATVAASIASRLLRVPHIVRLTGGGTTQFASEPFARASSAIGRRLVRFTLDRRRVFVVAPAEHLLHDMRVSFPRIKMATLRIPNGVAVPASEPDTSSERAGVAWYSRSGSEKSADFLLAVAEACPELEFVAFGQEIDCGGLTNLHTFGWCDDVPQLLARTKVLDQHVSG